MIDLLGGVMIDRLFQQPGLNFLLTNRIPRRATTRLIGWISRIESPVFVRLALRIWRVFAPELDLSESREVEFRSLRACFIRELKPGARPVARDPRRVVSPCDAIVGACGWLDDDVLIQAKGLPYRLEDLLGNPELVRRHRGGRFVTLRLKSTMYHRFHAPADCRVDEVTHIAGDTWNVNPIALERVERLYCRNERAVIPLELPDANRSLTLVAVAAIGVANIRLHCLDATLGLGWGGPKRIACDAAYARGEELGWFELGSTIVVLADASFELAEGIREGRAIRVGRPLLTESSHRPGLRRAADAGPPIELAARRDRMRSHADARGERT